MPLLRRAFSLTLLCALACAPRASAPGASGAAPATSAVERIPARKVRVRAYADDAYRSQSSTPWEERVKRQLARANEVTARRFGVTFELAGAR
ncbi:MAG TPA: hypothetical protein VFA20_27965, partial [Myxococcaceae bacterium]|nr:hypothetical protein [Myxococcaceae bacterium]